MRNKATGFHDKNGKEIHDGDSLRGKSIEGETLDYVVKWSNYRNGWLADNAGEIYDVAPSRFNEFEVIGSMEGAK